MYVDESESVFERMFESRFSVVTSPARRGNPTAGLNAGLGAPSIVTEFATNEVKVGIGSKKVSDVASTLPVLLTTLV